MKFKPLVTYLLHMQSTIKPNVIYIADHMHYTCDVDCIVSNACFFVVLAAHFCTSSGPKESTQKGTAS